MVIRERMESKEQETTGFWYTEEKLKKSGEYSAFSGRMFVWTVYSIILRSIPLMVCFIKYIR